MSVRIKKRALIGLAIMIILLVGVFLYSRYNPEDYVLFPKCIVYVTTGYKCPGCGSQRAFHNLFHGNVLTAFMHNPLIIFLVPYVLFGVFIAYIANRANPHVIYIQNVFFGKWAALVLGVIMLLYTVLRNLYL